MPPDPAAMHHTNLPRLARRAWIANGFGLAEPRPWHPQKKAINAKAQNTSVTAALLGRKGTFFIEASTPYLKIDRAALNQLKLQIFTHSIPLASPTSNTKATLITIGGKTGNMNLAPTGAQTLQPIKQVHLDLTAIRTSGLDTETEPSTTQTAEIDVKTEALHRNTPRISLVVPCPYQSDQSANKLPPNRS